MSQSVHRLFSPVPLFHFPPVIFQHLWVTLACVLILPITFSLQKLHAHIDLTCYGMTCTKLSLSFLLHLSGPLWHPPPTPREAEQRKWGEADPGVTPHRLLDPTSLHLSASRHNDKTVSYASLSLQEEDEEEEERGSGWGQEVLVGRSEKSRADM